MEPLVSVTERTREIGVPKAVAVSFAVWPALKASRLDPLGALRCG